MSWQTAYALALGIPILSLSVAGLVLILKEFEGLKFKEIAEVLGCPESTVKSVSDPCVRDRLPD